MKTQFKFISQIISCLVVVLLLSTNYANATSYTWMGTTSNAWGTTTNWSPNGTPGVADDVTFPSGKTRYPVLTADVSVNTIGTIGGALSGSSYTISVNSPCTITISGNRTQGCKYAFNADVTVSMPTTSDAITFNKVVSGSGGITVNGPGLVAFPAINTFSGGFTINSGTVNVNNASSLGDPANTVIINGGSINPRAAATLNDYTMIWNGNFSLGSGGYNLNLGSGSVAMTANCQISVPSGYSLTVGGSVSGSGYNLTKADAGALIFGNNDVSVNNLTISGGSITAPTAANVFITGDFTNNGSLSATSGEFNFDGTSAGQAIAGSGATTFYDLHVNNSSTGVTLTNSALLTVSNNLIIDPSSKFIIGAGKKVTVDAGITSPGTNSLVILSDSTSNTIGSLIESSPVSVPATVYRHIPTSYYYHLVSSPVESATASVFKYAWMYSWNEVTEWYDNITSLSTPLTPMKGYSVWLTHGSGAKPANPVCYSGNLNSSSTSTQTISCTQSGGAFDGFNMVGNPYPSAIDWNAIVNLIQDVDDAVYCWDGANNYYSSFVNGVSINNGTRYVGVGQGFYVHASYPCDFFMDNTVRTHTSASVFRSADPPNVLKLKISDNTLSDETAIRFVYGATTKFDVHYDALKMFGYASAPQIYSRSSDSFNLSINAMTDTTIYDSSHTPISISVGHTGNYKIIFSGMMNFDTSLVIAVQDTKANKTQVISSIDTMYSFQADSGKSVDRFIIWFYKKQTPTSINHSVLKDIRAYSNYNKLFIDLNGLKTNNAEFSVQNMSGQTVVNRKITSNHLTSYSLDLPTGTYIVRISANGKFYDKKLYFEK